MTSALAQERRYTVEDIYGLPEGSRAELVDGRIYYMAPPNRKHQTIARELFSFINSYIKSKGGSCEPFFAPVAVFLNEDDINYVEPDISVICDSNKLTDKGCCGAPDRIIEIRDYTFSDSVKAGIYDDLFTDFSCILKSLSV